MKLQRSGPGKDAQRPTFVVGIGGSAGGLNAYRALLEALPADTGMAFVFVTHILPTATSQLADLLSRRTKMPVLIAADGMPIRPNHVYVSAPNMDLRMVDFAFRVVSPRTKGNAEVDCFFTSLAEAMGVRAIGVVLSGWDGDGTEGCLLIKAKGGTVFAQDMSAEVSGMPLSVEASGCVDFVLPPDKIAKKLAQFSLRARKG